MPIRRVDTTEIEYNSGDNTYTLPTTRGENDYVLTRDNSIGTGGTTWKETISAPSITNISGEINEDTNTTLTVTGSGFASGMTIKLINSSSGADITGHTALSYSGISSPLTVTIPSGTTNLTAGLQVKLHINKQGLTTASSQVITVSEDPNWTTTSGTFATINDTLGASQTVGTLSASAGAGGGTIVYASDDSSLDATYFSLASNGVITTTSTALTGLTGSANYTETFNANAKVQGSESTKNTLLSGINIIVNKSPTGGATGGSGSPTSGAYSRYTHGGTTYQVHKFITTGNSNFVLYSAKTVDVIVVGGGGSGGQGSVGTGGGGGGAGGLLVRTGLSLTAGTYLVKVGAGGVTSNGTNVIGSNGDDSYFGYVDGSLSTATELKGFGGGGGGAYTGSSYLGGSNGGSGGGASYSTNSGGTSTQTSHNSGTGHGSNGGAYVTGTYCGGGGGAGGNTTSGVGGAGLNNFLTDVATTAALLNSLQSGNGGPAGDGYLAGGGGGGGENSNSTTRKAGGAGGGGQGGAHSSNKNGEDGVANTGSGGGGIGRTSGQSALDGTGGDGGSGIVIVRYAI